MAADLEHTNDNFSRSKTVFRRYTLTEPGFFPEIRILFFSLCNFSWIFQLLENIMARVIPSLSLFLHGTVASLRPRDGFQIQYSSTRSADLLGFDLFQLFSVLLTHGSNASQMYQAEWLDRLTSGKEQRLRKSKSEKQGKKSQTEVKKNLEMRGCHQTWMHSAFFGHFSCL